MTGRSEPDPQEIDALLAQVNQGRLDVAEALARSLTVRHPGHAFGWKALGVVRSMSGRFAEALEPLSQAVRLQPGDVEAHGNLGGARLESGRYAEACASHRHALAIAPGHAKALGDLGNALLALRDPTAAQASFRRALAVAPLSPDTQIGLGRSLAETTRPAAAAAFRRALAIAPSHAKAHRRLADALSGRGDLPGALACHRRALAIQPMDLDAWRGFARLCRLLGRLPEGEAACRAGLARGPGDLDLHRILAAMLFDGGRPEEAQAPLRAILATHPAQAAAFGTLGDVMRAQGLVPEARACQRRAIALAPDSAEFARSHLCTLLYSDQETPATLFRQAVAFGGRYAPQDAPLPPPPNGRSPDRPLRIGFLSSDFRMHPLARNIRALFEHRDRAAAVFACYAQTVRIDDGTQWYRASADVWRDITAMSDRETAECIRADGIDLLVVLGGHFDANRPLVAAYRPAPIQLSLHDGATSGVAGMDWFIGDPVLTPQDGPERFTEQVARLPVLYNHPPRFATPIAGRRPAADGEIVFGSFNAPAKLSSSILALWARVLIRLPRSRLLLKYYRAFESAAARGRVLDILATGGVAADRISFMGAGDHEDAPLARYGQIDIALDSHPFAGATTTYEALWMGVPVVTLASGGFVGRASAAHLVPLGLDDLVAATPDDFVGIAVRLARDPDRLGALRRGLRDRILASPLVDGPGYARNMETLFRSLWRAWCAP